MAPCYAVVLNDTDRCELLCPLILFVYATELSNECLLKCFIQTAIGYFVCLFEF